LKSAIKYLVVVNTMVAHSIVK